MLDAFENGGVFMSLGVGDGVCFHVPAGLEYRSTSLIRNRTPQGPTRGKFLAF